MNNFGLLGYFNVIKKKSDGSIVERYDFQNLILNSGLNMLGENANSHRNYFSYCHLGAGNSQPIETQTLLDNWLGSASDMYNGRNVEWKIDNHEKSVSFTYKYRFNVGIATGNISEIGISNLSNSSDVLFCRALIKDAQGQPTVITKLNDEILEVFYTLKVIINAEDKIGVGLIDGVEYNYILRPAYLGSLNDHDGIFSSKEIADITSYPYADTRYKTVNVAQYEPNSKRLKYTMSVGIDEANFPIRSVMFMSIFGLRWQCQFSNKLDNSAIPKTKEKTLKLNFYIKWGRA